MSLSKPAEFIEAFRPHDIDPVVFCTYLLHESTRTGDVVTASTTAGEFDIDIAAAKHLHNVAADFGLGSFPDINTANISVNNQHMIKFVQFLEEFTKHATENETRLLANDGVHEVNLCISVPDGFNDRNADLTARLTQLVRNAEEELVVVTPFFTRFAVDIFVNHLVEATNRGVEVTMITRDGGADGDNNEYITTIQEAVHGSGNTSNFQLYNYDSDNGNLHAKAVIADNSECYVGSANLTKYSLQEAIEIGLIVRGSVVTELQDFFKTVQESSNTDKLPTTPA